MRWEWRPGGSGEALGVASTGTRPAPSPPHRLTLRCPLLQGLSRRVPGRHRAASPACCRLRPLPAPPRCPAALPVSRGRSPGGDTGPLVCPQVLPVEAPPVRAAGLSQRRPAPSASDREPAGGFPRPPSPAVAFLGRGAFLGRLPDGASAVYKAMEKLIPETPSPHSRSAGRCFPPHTAWVSGPRPRPLPSLGALRTLPSSGPW